MTPRPRRPPPLPRAAAPRAAAVRVLTAALRRQAGAPAGCRETFLAGEREVAALARSAAGRARLARALRTCAPLRTADEAAGLIAWLQEPWSYLAMGNFPWPSGYVIHGRGALPAWPVREACARLTADAAAGGGGAGAGDALLARLREASGVFYNHSGDAACFYNGAPAHSREAHARHGLLGRGRGGGRGGGAEACAGDWGWQWCTEMAMPFSNDGKRDMCSLARPRTAPAAAGAPAKPPRCGRRYWPAAPWNETAAADGCEAAWGVRPRPHWAVTECLSGPATPRLSAGPRPPVFLKTTFCLL